MAILLIHRSILKELLLSFFLSLLFLNFTLMMEKLLRLSRILSGVGASLGDMAKIILYLQPQILILTIPMALLLSVLLTFGRLNADSELIILKNCGMSFRRISLPVLYLGLAFLMVGLSMSFYLGPKGAILVREKVTEILTTRAALAIEEGIFNTAFKDIVLLVREKPSPDRLSGIFIVDERKKEEQKIIIAREGKVVQENEAMGFLLRDGHIYITKKNILTEIQFGAYRFALTPSAEPAQKKSSERTPLELLAAAKEVSDKSKKNQYLLEFYRRLSMPAVCIIIIFLGPSLSLMAGKSGRLGGLTVGLLVFVVYYTILLYGESLSRSGRLPLLIGAWLSFVVLGAFSIFVFEKVNRR